jgi:hypothetical protein
MKSEKMRNVLEELLKEKDELYAFVGEKFRETAIRLNIPAPKGFPKVNLTIEFFLRQKDFEKSCMKFDGYYGSPIEKRLENLPVSRTGAVTLTQKKDGKLTAYIFVNCIRERAEAAKNKLALKKMLTVSLIHEMCHVKEAQTGVYLLKSSVLTEDGFSLPVYEAWQKLEMDK